MSAPINQQIAQRIAFSYPRVNSEMLVYPVSGLLLNSGMNVKDVRRQHLATAIDKFGSIEALADATGTNPKHLSQLRNGHRNIGDRFARKLEAALSLAPNAWDAPSPVDYSSAVLASAGEDELLEAVTAALGTISPDGKKKLLRAISEAL